MTASGAAPLWACEVTAEVVAQAEPRVEALLRWWAATWHEVRSRQLPLAALRWVGFGFSLLAVVMAGFLIVVTPDSPCRPAPTLQYDALAGLAALFATFFWFQPRLRPAMEAWTLRMASQQATRLCARLRSAAPWFIDYTLEGGRLVGRSEKLRSATATDLRRVERAAFAGEVACLYGGRFPFLVKRLIWTPDEQARGALREALAAAGVEVVELR